jgi:hypothetical protein
MSQPLTPIRMKDVAKTAVSEAIRMSLALGLTPLIDGSNISLSDR